MDINESLAQSLEFGFEQQIKSLEVYADLIENGYVPPTDDAFHILRRLLLAVERTKTLTQNVLVEKLKQQIKQEG